MVARPPEPTTARVPLRPYPCPRCDRYLFSSNAERGIARQHCRNCRRWLLIDLATGREAREVA